MHDHQETETEETEDSVSAIYNALTDEEYEILAKWDRRGRFV